MFGSEMTRVGRRPTHMVKIGPYFFDHSWNCIHGFDVGNLFPMKGRGGGPGGIRSHFHTSLSSINSGMTAIPATAYHEVNIETAEIFKFHSGHRRMSTRILTQS